jgi:hypothetical protein
VIPKIFMREARRVAKPLVFEDNNGIPVNIAPNSELLGGIQGPAPPITGFVLTTLKENSLVDVVLSTPRQPQPNSAILATWQYGLGRAVALTTDIGQRWATNWPKWENYDKLILQTVRWSMRSHDLDNRLALSIEARDGAIDVVVNALDRVDNNLNYLNLTGSVILPNGDSQEIAFQQAAPGRYTAKLPAEEPGNYFVAVTDSRGSAPVRATVNVGNTAELQKLTSYDGYLAELAEGKPKDGDPGKLIQASGGIADTPGLLKTDVFRPGIAPAKSRRPMWPAVLVATGLIFFTDVFCRRVHVSLDWVLPLVAGILGSGNRAGENPASDQMERLRHSKSGATRRYARTGAAGRFESSSADVVDSVDPTTISIPDGEPASASPQPDDELPPADFTARLLEVKKSMRDKRT